LFKTIVLSFGHRPSGFNKLGLLAKLKATILSNLNDALGPTAYLKKIKPEFGQVPNTEFGNSSEVNWSIFI
jgi:hypothetical protein